MSASPLSRRSSAASSQAASRGEPPRASSSSSNPRTPEGKRGGSGKADYEAQEDDYDHHTIHTEEDTTHSEPRSHGSRPRSKAESEKDDSESRDQEDYASQVSAGPISTKSAKLSQQLSTEPSLEDLARALTAEVGQMDGTLADRAREEDEALEKEFQAVMRHLAEDDENVGRFRVDYEKLHRALLKSREAERKLVRKCKELNAELVANAAKVQAALKLSQDDRSTIATLKKEIKKAWRMVESSSEKEAKSKEAIAQLKQELNNLSKLIGQGGLVVGMDGSNAATMAAVMASGNATNGSDLLVSAQETAITELTKTKEELTKEKDYLSSELEFLRAQNVELTDRLQNSDIEKAENERELNTLKDIVTSKKTEMDRELRARERLERELREFRVNLEAKNNEIRQRGEAINRGKEEVSRLENTIKEHKGSLEKLQKDFENLTARASKSQQDYEEQILYTKQLLAENQQKEAEIKLKDDDLSKLREELKAVNKVKDTLTKKVKATDDSKLEVETERDSLKSTIVSLERELEAMKKQIEVDKKAQNELVRERDLLNKNLLKVDHATQKQASAVKVHEQAKRNLEQEIQGYKEEAAKQRKIIYQLEKERDRSANDASEMQQRCVAALEEVKIKEMQIFDYKKKISDAETKLKQQQNLYEAVRSDRNLYSKNLIESQDEITEMKRKLKIMNHQIDQLKEEITAKENALVKEHFEHLKVEKEKDGLKLEVNKLKQQNDLAQQYINNQNAEETKLRHIITEADNERMRQKKEFEAIVQERDILGTQLIRRNDELALLYEKIKIQTSALHSGELAYRERLEDIRVLKLEIRKLRRDRSVLQNAAADVDGLRNEMYRIQKELLRERTRVKALEEELENPMNIHRWRKLEGSDPNTYEMVQKIQTLQKRLIAKTEEVVEKELTIREKERLYAELKAILARQPGPEVIEQLNVYQQSIKEKTKQLKAMASELNMYQAQANEYRYEIERVNREMQDVKKRYFEQKRREQWSSDHSGAVAEKLIKAHPLPHQPKFVGGGYNMTKVAVPS